jgi:hypothetical protein
LQQRQYVELDKRPQQLGLLFWIEPDLGIPSLY